MAGLGIILIFETGARIGPSEVKLLESIRDTGSISAAAREMSASHGHAWVLLDSINQASTEPVALIPPGGTAGRASLTQFGFKVLARYNRTLVNTELTAAADLAALAELAHLDDDL